MSVCVCKWVSFNVLILVCPSVEDVCLTMCPLVLWQGEEGPPSLEYIQAKDLFPQKDLVKEEESLQVRTQHASHQGSKLTFWSVKIYEPLTYKLVKFTSHLTVYQHFLSTSHLQNLPAFGWWLTWILLPHKPPQPSIKIPLYSYLCTYQSVMESWTVYSVLSSRLHVYIKST